jgi:hypothetical protein
MQMATDAAGKLRSNPLDGAIRNFRMSLDPKREGQIDAGWNV